MREILAAWAVCGLVGLAALTLTGHRDPGIAVAARAHIADRLGSTHPGVSIEDEFADTANDAASIASSSEKPSVYPRQDVVAKSGRCRLQSFAHRLLSHVDVLG